MQTMVSFQGHHIPLRNCAFCVKQSTYILSENMVTHTCGIVIRQLSESSQNGFILCLSVLPKKMVVKNWSLPLAEVTNDTKLVLEDNQSTFKSLGRVALQDRIAPIFCL
jgi:hypothetical protein